MKCFLSLMLLCINSVAKEIDLTFVDYKPYWQEWKSFYGKTYKSEAENTKRFSVWMENLKFIQQHNSEGHSYALAMNHFGDRLTVDEYRFDVTGLRSSLFIETEREGSTFLPSNVADLPPSVDWRTKGYVTHVKNQGPLGSCWAFSVTGSVEGQHFKKTGQLVSLSEQNLVDCSGCYRDDQNDFLHEAFADCGFKYIIRNGGIDTETGYPYPCNKSCCFEKVKVGATLSGYMDIQSGNESALQYAVATVGPISVAIEAGHQSFQFYRSGVYNNPDCSSVALDHGVLIVGYGTYEGQDYWLVKNSWGTNWGMEGYIMMSRNKNNQCGIATNASYPLV